jgi:hypothetical protein
MHGEDNNMKNFKLLAVVLMLAVLSASLVFGQATEKPYNLKTFTFTLKGDYMSIADPDYGDLYGKKKYFPEGEIEVRLTGNLYLWGSYSLVSGKGGWDEWSNKSLIDPDVRWNITSSRHQFAAGAGYFIGLHDPGQFVIRLQLGLCFINQIEDSEKILAPTGAQLETNRSIAKKIGGIGELGLNYVLWKNIFAEVSIAYIYATKQSEDENGDTVTDEIGGLRIGLGLGVRF